MSQFPVAFPDTPEASPIAIPSVADVVYQRLRRDIARGDYRPGPLRIKTLTDRFRVSATPVREALRRLEADGLVTLRNRQIAVNALSVSEMREIYAIRALLEAFALRQAGPHIYRDTTVLRKLTLLIDAMDRFETSPDEWRAADEEFHTLLYRAAGMRRLDAIIRVLWVAVEPYLRLYVSSATSFRAAQEQHRLLLSHLEAGEFDAAGQVMQQHLYGTRDLLTRGVRQNDYA